MMASPLLSNVSTSIASPMVAAWSNSAVMGSGWMFSSIIFSTYFTTEFLKYEENGQASKIKDLNNDFILRQHEFMKTHKRPLLQKQRQAISEALKSLSRPQLLTLYRFSGSLLMGIFVHTNVFAWKQRLLDTIKYMPDFALSAIFLFVANYSNSIALDRIGISLTYTSKCIIPLITVLLSVSVDGLKALPCLPALLMLIPIATGVALTSWSSPTFEKKGFIAAMLSSTAQAALNVSSKRALSHTKISGLDAQRSMASVAFIIAIFMSLQTSIKSKLKMITDGDDTEISTKSNVPPSLPPFSLSLAAAAAYHYEYVLSFIFLNLVQPISYGTCDAVRRLGIIVAGRAFFGGEPFSSLNYIGITLALLGATGYSIFSAR
ncbi:hypothetical protein CTEN210_10742 [Chaetoceros tenuissimus]|uniref:Sugar phosphate transporter domain-containing protein n=1 Tax=Chaetoceros tenuissimus TaxID=426638 RepID=A0AAD3CY08_9STRA|nr:hypothetical protein CTEN210_10742 [Chaetoceros tenuissimus]